MTETTTLTDEKVAALVRGRAHYQTAPHLEVRDVAESGRFIEGRAIPYNTWADLGWFREMFLPGSFKKSIREAARQLPLLLFHDQRSFPIGVSHEWRDNDDGLDCVWRLDADDPRAMDAARKAASGELIGLSIGFAPVERISKNAAGDRVDLNNVLEYDRESDVLSVTRHEARLLEISLTPTPAYVGARVAKVRERQKSTTAAWWDILNGLR